MTGTGAIAAAPETTPGATLAGSRPTRLTRARQRGGVIAAVAIW